MNFFHHFGGKKHVLRIAQGAKPGEGGQLPGPKAIFCWIADLEPFLVGWICCWAFLLTEGSGTPHKKGP